MESILATRWVSLAEFECNPDGEAARNCSLAISLREQILAGVQSGQGIPNEVLFAELELLYA